MDSVKTKTMVYIMILSVAVMLSGLAFMKFSTTGQDSQTEPQKTQAQKLNDLENSSGMTSPQAKNFINNEKERQSATKEVEDTVGH